MNYFKKALFVLLLMATMLPLSSAAYASESGGIFGKKSNSCLTFISGRNILGFLKKGVHDSYYKKAVKKKRKAKSHRRSLAKAQSRMVVRGK
ncbi:MAG: hypothetical protein LPK14_06715 [Hymenobacteraceae bacterium]|nr:hypothetical protein [Hymenobacteraceae bacterium]